MEMRIDEHRLTLTGTGWPLTGAVRHRMMERTVTHEKPLDAAWSVAWIRGAAAAVAEHRDELTELDRAIGDGDHGINLDRGMHAAVAKLDSQESGGGIPLASGRRVQGDGDEPAGHGGRRGGSASGDGLPAGFTGL